MRPEIAAVVANMIGVLLGVLALTLLEGAIELLAEGGADAAVVPLLIPAAGLIALTSVILLLVAHRLW
ncbi:MAG: hypothetical protein E7Z94_07715 [Actinomyces ruminicola]|uniref:Uncharacterized protein n=1 Tax=Actinomyces ruminicola TaxID=332524 RepID=A0A1G9ZXI7_9ACTO|nr:hypothetical protein [Actinomyces ruminicola]MBE6482242.1 hypothetical protein [Actinomyces ruminicola]SDN25236.1 hypothetical protein SAMN04487766_12013 [Actinomyces ruminicola]